MNVAYAVGVHSQGNIIHSTVIYEFAIPGRNSLRWMDGPTSKNLIKAALKRVNPNIFGGSPGIEVDVRNDEVLCTCCDLR